MHSLQAVVRVALCACACALATVAVRGNAQQASGLVFNPVTSPVNPNLVSYETLVGDRQELKFRLVSDPTKQSFPATRTVSSPSVGLIGLPGLSNNNVSVFSGDMDWRPAIGIDGNQWFAYVASDQGVFKLYINYIDSFGQLASGPAIQLPFATSAHQPRWSPDGRHLAFVSDSSALQIFWNVDASIRTGNAGALRATRIIEARTGVLSPAWSPKSNYIAYQAERDVRGARRYQIEVLGVDVEAHTVRGQPIVLTDDLNEANAFRPSWSGDARYVAFYVDRFGNASNAASGVLDIGIVEAQTQPTTGRILRGELLRGQSNRLAERVFANSNRGPGWTNMYIEGAKRPAILYVQRDDSRGNPIYVHSLDRWLKGVAGDSARVGLATLSRTINNREATATESDGFVRYTFASVSGGGEIINIVDDSSAKWARGRQPVLPRRVAQVPPPVISTISEPKKVDPPKPEPKKVDAPKPEARKPEYKPEVKKPEVRETPTAATTTHGSSLGMAFLFPGAGQFAGGSKAKGALYTAAGLVGASLVVLGSSGTSSAATAGQTAADNFNHAGYLAAKSDYDSKHSLQLGGAGVLGLAWVVGIVDAAMHRGSAHGYSLISNPPQGRMSSGTAGSLGLRIPFGGSSR